MSLLLRTGGWEEFRKDENITRLNVEWNKQNEIDFYARNGASVAIKLAASQQDNGYGTEALSAITNMPD